MCEDVKTPLCHNRVRVFAELYSGANKHQTSSTHPYKRCNKSQGVEVSREQSLQEHNTCPQSLPFQECWGKYDGDQGTKWVFPQLNPPVER